MLIVNADDWGRSVAETDAALHCLRGGRISSASAMVFMPDSSRAAALALEHRVDVGLHLNFSQPFAACAGVPAQLLRSQERVCGFINLNKYALLLYNPALAEDFRRTYEAQVAEFHRLYGKLPSHVDGHHHKHLCSNVLFGDLIPSGVKLRRSFFFWPGEKGWLNRAYRRLTDRSLARRYRSTDYFFGLSQCLGGERLARVLDLAKTSAVELMTHPVTPAEMRLLESDAYARQVRGIELGTYSSI